MIDNPNSVTSVIAENNVLSVIPSDNHMEAELLKQLKRVAIATEHCFNKALDEQASIHGKNIYLNLASKLTRSYASLSIALSRSRGGVTQQTITVQHLHVSQGGGYNKNGD
jgi:hypothetical protein